MSALYVHIPFCASACPYCDFAFVVRKGHLAGRYAEALCTEIRARASEFAPVLDTLYFGGGTPSAVEPEGIGRVLDAARSVCSLDPACEITVEANPGDRARFAALRSLGVRRLSLGVQALHDRALKALGRFHTARDAGDAVARARSAGFANLNLDLIFGAPGQGFAEWKETLDRALSLGPEHLSVYGLTVEPGTPFHRRREKGRLSLPGEDAQAEMYGHALDRLGAEGYEHYEISNFARPGFRSRHNLACWRGRPYVGVGMGAHSFSGTERAWNDDRLESYLASVEARGRAPRGRERLTQHRHRLERVMLGLRTSDGVPGDLLLHTAGHDRLDALLRARLVERSGRAVRLTRRGALVADAVCEALVGAL